MKSIQQHITERLQLNKDRVQQYKYIPDTKQELREILEEKLKKDKNADLNDIDVSKITDMGAKDLGKVEDEYGFVDEMGLFERLDPHNIKINNWNVSNVEDMTGMFSFSEFNQDISKWNVSNVVNMANMFRYSEFNNDISDWDISNVENMYGIFYNSKFNQDLTSWKDKIKNSSQLKYIQDYIK